MQHIFCKTLHGNHEVNIVFFFQFMKEKRKGKKEILSCLSVSSSGEGDPGNPEKCALISFLFFVLHQWTMCALWCCVSIFTSLKPSRRNVIPLCRLCSSWDQIVQPSPRRILHSCHTWGFQKQLAHCYFHVQSILYTVF